MNRKKQKIELCHMQYTEESRILLNTYTEAVRDIMEGEEDEEYEEEHRKILVAMPGVRFDAGTYPTYQTWSVRMTGRSEEWKDHKVLIIYAEDKRWFLRTQLKKLPRDCALISSNRKMIAGVQTRKIHRGTPEYKTLSNMGFNAGNPKELVLLDADGEKWVDLIKPVVAAAAFTVITPDFIARPRSNKTPA